MSQPLVLSRVGSHNGLFQQHLLPIPLLPRTTQEVVLVAHEEGIQGIALGKDNVVLLLHGRRGRKKDGLCKMNVALVGEAGSEIT